MKKLITTLVMLFSTTAWAQNFDIERFRPASDITGIVNVESGYVPDWYESQAWFDYSFKPLSKYVRNADGSRTFIGSVVGERWKSNLVQTVPVVDGVSLGLNVPTVWRQVEFSDPFNLGSLRSGGLGDIALTPKFQLFDNRELTLAFLSTVTLPTANDDSFLGEKNATVTPSLALSWEDRLSWAVNFGYKYRENQNFTSLSVAPELLYAAGVSYGVSEDVEVASTLYGTTAANSPWGRANQNSTELSLSATWNIMGGVDLTGGGALGLNEGYGTANRRMFVGFQWAFGNFVKDWPREKDTFDDRDWSNVDTVLIPTAVVYFDFDKSNVDGKASATLQKFVKDWYTTVIHHAVVNVNVVGHTDNRGSNDYNLALGLCRADAVKQYLVNLGVRESLIQVTTRGEEEATDSKTEQGHALNRKAVVTLEIRGK